jgi:hypothetical protein
MANQSATVVFNPDETDTSQLVNAFADAKAARESRFTLELIGDAADAAGDPEGSGSSAPPLPPGAPDFGGSSEADSAPPAPSGGDFEVSLEPPAE